MYYVAGCRFQGEKPVLEKQIEAELVKRVTAIGGRCDKVEVIGRRGFFDRLVLLPGGRVAFVETKLPGLRLSANQEFFHDAYEKRGAEVRIVRCSADIDALLKGLESS